MTDMAHYVDPVHRLRKPVVRARHSAGIQALGDKIRAVSSLVRIIVIAVVVMLPVTVRIGDRPGNLVTVAPGGFVHSRISGRSVLKYAVRQNSRLFLYSKGKNLSFSFFPRSVLFSGFLRRDRCVCFGFCGLCETDQSCCLYLKLVIISHRKLGLVGRSLLFLH